LVEDTATGELPFTVSDVDTPLENLVMYVSSSNPALIPDQNVFFTGTGSNRTVRIVPARNGTGYCEVALIAFDGQVEGIRVVVVNVTPVNDPPVITLLQTPPVIMQEDVERTVQFLVQDPETLPNALNPTVESADQALIPNNQLTITGTTALRVLRIRPALNAYGSTTLTIHLLDSEGSETTASLPVTVQEVNDPPTLDPIPNVVMDEDGARQTVTLTGITSGAPDEHQTLGLVVTAADPAVTGEITVQYQSPNPTATLSFQPAPNVFGTTTVSVVVEDSPGAAMFQRDFQVQVRGVNDRPTITSISNIVLNEDESSLPVSFTVNDQETPPERLTVTPFSSNEELVPLSGILMAGLGSQRFVTIKPAANQFGSASIALTVTDENGGSDFVFFDVTVNSVNDLPTVSAIPNLSLNTERPSAVVPYTVSDDDTPAPLLVVTLESTNPTLLPPGTLVTDGTNSQRTLTVAPAVGQSGTALVTLTVKDASGGETKRRFGVSFYGGPLLRIGQAGGNALLSWSTNYPNHFPEQRNGMGGN
jgi:hypothetical protein